MRVGYRFILMGLFVLLGHVVGRGIEAQTQRQHDAHVHGAGTLNLVQEGNQVHIELEIPGMDIVGFEHQATSSSQKEAVKEAVTVLRQGNSLFHINAEAKCTFDTAEIEVAMMQEEHEGENHERHHHESEQKKGEKADHHDHEKEGEAHKEDEQHKEDHHAEDEEDRHSEFHAQYVFTCASPDKLMQLRTTLFDQFQKSESLKAQFVTSRKQSSQQLSRQTPVLNLN